MSDSGALLRSWEGRDIDAWRAAWHVPALEIHRTLGSTNDRARALAADGAAGGTTILADVQTAGRGRHGRAWVAPGGRGLLLSMVLRPASSMPHEVAYGALPLRVGLAVTRAVERVAGIGPRLKWPNDVLVDGRKLAGILCETAHAAGRVFAIAGIGLNVDQTADELPAGVLATSFRLLGWTVQRSSLAGALIAELLLLATSPLQPLDAAELAAFAARDALRGRTVRLEPDGATGRAEGVDADGALRLRQPDGRLVRRHGGTVRFMPNENPGPP
ncbi:MAG: biotin--[acetyl-CoA-carboxylase] ligase [Longimicrobiales bacterium]